MGSVISAIFGGGSKAPPPPDNSAQERQLAQMRADSAAEKTRLDAQQAKLDDEKRRTDEQLAAKMKARRGGGVRQLMDAQRLNAEAGLPGQDSATRNTLGPK